MQDKSIKKSITIAWVISWVALISLIVWVGWTPGLDHLSSRLATHFLQQPIRLTGVRFSSLNGFAFGRVDLTADDGTGLATGGPGKMTFKPSLTTQVKVRFEVQNLFMDPRWSSAHFSWFKPILGRNDVRSVGPVTAVLDLVSYGENIQMIRIRHFELQGIRLQGGILMQKQNPTKGNLAMSLTPEIRKQLTPDFSSWLEQHRMRDGLYQISWTKNNVTFRDPHGPRVKAAWQSRV